MHIKVILQEIISKGDIMYQVLGFQKCLGSLLFLCLFFLGIRIKWLMGLPAPSNP